MIAAVGRDDNNSKGSNNSYRCTHCRAERLLPPTIGQRDEWSDTAARNVCRSAEYFLQPHMSDASSTSLLAALAFVKAYWTIIPGHWHAEIA